MSSSNFFKKLADSCEVSGNEVECTNSKQLQSGTYSSPNEACCMPQSSCYKGQRPNHVNVHQAPSSSNINYAKCSEIARTNVDARTNDSVPFNGFGLSTQQFHTNPACTVKEPIPNYQQLLIPQFQEQNSAKTQKDGANRDFAYQSDLFGKHCGYASLLGNNVNSDQDANRQYRFPNDKEAHCQYERETNPEIAYHQPSSFQYQDVSRSRDDERRDVAKYEGFTLSDKAANEGISMTAISSSRNETYETIAPEVQSPKNDASLTAGRGNILASPGNSCIVSSTDTGRTYSDDGVGQKPVWSDKPGKFHTKFTVIFGKF